MIMTCFVMGSVDALATWILFHVESVNLEEGSFLFLPRSRRTVSFATIDVNPALDLVGCNAAASIYTGDSLALFDRFRVPRS